jgi:hypothetical protein
MFVRLHSATTQKTQKLETKYVEVSEMHAPLRCFFYSIVGTTVTDIPWPQEEEQFSKPAQTAVDTLLTLDPLLRPAAPQVKQMSLFSALDWDNLLSTTAPFMPQPDNSTDTVYFQGVCSSISQYSRPLVVIPSDSLKQSFC